MNNNMKKSMKENRNVSETIMRAMFENIRK